MNFIALLSQTKERNKALFEAERITISIVSLENLLKKFYDIGYKDADEFHKSLQNLSKDKNKTDFNDLFGGIFGKK